MFVFPLGSFLTPVTACRVYNKYSTSNLSVCVCVCVCGHTLQCWLFYYSPSHWNRNKSIRGTSWPKTDGKPWKSWAVVKEILTTGNNKHLFLPLYLTAEVQPNQASDRPKAFDGVLALLLWTVNINISWSSIVLLSLQKRSIFPWILSWLGLLLGLFSLNYLKNNPIMLKKAQRCVISFNISSSLKKCFGQSDPETNKVQLFVWLASDWPQYVALAHVIAKTILSSKFCSWTDLFGKFNVRCSCQM